MVETKIAEYIDATDPVLEDLSGNIRGAANYLHLAQSFTTSSALAVAIIKKVVLKLGFLGTNTGDIIIELRAVDGAHKPSTLIDSVSYAASNVTATTYYDITGWTKASLNASTEYAIVVIYPSATATKDIYWYGESAIGDDYISGYGWFSSNFGTTWTATDAAGDVVDFNFAVWGTDFDGTLCLYQDVVQKAGAGADATGVSQIYVSQFVKQAEGILNARTKIKWNDEYATLDSNVKYILNEIVSSLAAIKVINYDMSGYTSRLEAEEMKQTLRAEAERYIDEIKKADIKEFILNA